MSLNTHLQMEYFGAYETLIRHDSERQPTFFDDLIRLDGARQRLADSPPPDDGDLRALLRSTSPHDQQVALVNIAVRKRGWKVFIESAPFLFSTRNDPGTRGTVYSCVNVSSPETFAAVEDYFLNLISKETNQLLLTETLPLICRVQNPNKTVPVFATLLKNSDDRIKSFAMAMLTSRHCDPKIKQDVIDTLSEEGDENTLRFVKELEENDKRGPEEVEKYLK